MAAVERPGEAYLGNSHDLPGTFPNAQHEALLTTQQSLAQAVYARRDEYTEPKKIRIKIGSWNVGNSGAERDIGAWFAEGKGVDTAFSGVPIGDDVDGHGGKSSIKEATRGQETRQQKLLKKTDPTVPLGKEDTIPYGSGEDIDLYVLGLQEIIDVTSPAEALRPYTDPVPAGKYKTAVEECLPPGYILVADQQLIGLLILVYASADLSKDVRSVCTSNVGTGLMGYMGNKGAVAVHMIIGEATRLLFINSHLAAGADKTALERRNWDAAQIQTRTRFAEVHDPSGIPISGGERIGDEDFAFWFGDLNYRLESIPGEDVRRILSRHSKDNRGSQFFEDISFDDISGKASTLEPISDVDEVPDDLDPDSLQTTISSLWPHDELSQQIKLRKAFHEGWEEGPVTFLPTYKYDVGKVSVFDSSEKKRSPSWCDRILYRTRNNYLAYRKRAEEEEAARIKDEEMRAQGLDGSDKDNDESALFEYNPSEDGHLESEPPVETKPEKVETRDGGASDIILEYYTSHQRVLSSDHKPLDAIFSLTYRGVVPEKKSKIHAEVARELDRAENEGRPMVTVVIEKAHFEKSENVTDDESQKGEHQQTPGGHAFHPSDVSETETDGIVHFGYIKFDKPKQTSITVANTGQVPATIGLIDRPVAGLGEEGPTPPWLSAIFDIQPDPTHKKSNSDKETEITDIEGPQYTLQPGDTCSISFIALISTPDLARNLNDNVMALDEILILRVKGGRDHFIPVQGRWVRTSVGGRGVKSRKNTSEGGLLRKSEESSHSERSNPIEKLKGVAEDAVRKLQNQKTSGSGIMNVSSPKSIWNPFTKLGGGSGHMSDG
jgi:phosphatidylinositol-bisphosphatase